MKHLMTIRLFITGLTMLATQLHAEDNVFHSIVAQDGTGSFATIQDAIDAAPDSSAIPYIIYIKAGHYHEHLYIPASKPNLHLVGQSRRLVRVSDDRVSGGPNASPVDVAATMVVHATDTYLEGITFENSWGTRHLDGPQALALYTKMDRNIVNRCAMLSYQDTYRTANALNWRNYVKDCFIEGAIDFLYGQGNVFFDRCTLNITRRQGGWIVAPKHDEGTTWGYVLKNTTITAPGNPQETEVWLGRPWLHSPKAVFIDTRAEVTIPKEGWYDHMSTLPAVFADYNTTDAAGNRLDLSRRIDRYYKLTEQKDTIWGTAKNHLTDAEASRYTIDNVLRGDDNWNPQQISHAPEAPEVTVKGRKLSWEPVVGARGYIISRNGKVVAITTKTQFIADAKGEKYTVQTVGATGNISRQIDE